VTGARWGSGGRRNRESEKKSASGEGDPDGVVLCFPPRGGSWGESGTACGLKGGGADCLKERDVCLVGLGKSVSAEGRRGVS